MIRFIMHRRMRMDPQNEELAFRMAAASIFSGNMSNVRARPNTVFGGGVHRMGDTVHVHGWDELRWILQLGPHLLAAAVHQSQLPIATEIDGSPDSLRHLEATKRRRQTYIHESLILKKVKESTSKFSTLQPEEPKSDIYVSLSDPIIIPPPVVNSSDLDATDKENNPGNTSRDDKQLQLDGKTSDEAKHHSSPSCAICLKNYNVGDAICWSRNPKCSHHFHSSCVEMWLLRNDNCPMCREPYLECQQLADDGDDQDETTSEYDNLEMGIRVPPLRPEEIENLERGPINPTTADGVDDPVEAAELMEMMAGIERLYRQAHDRLILQTDSGRSFQITISRPDSPSLSDIETEIFPPTR